MDTRLYIVVSSIDKMAGNDGNSSLDHGPHSRVNPKDALVMASILKEMGVNEYEPRLINQMLEFSYRK